MGSFLEYIYKGEYFPKRIGDARDGPLESDPSIPVPDHNGAQLLKHARIYTIAEKFLMPVCHMRGLHWGALPLTLRSRLSSHWRTPKSTARPAPHEERSPTRAMSTRQHQETTQPSGNLSPRSGLRVHMSCDTRPKRNSGQCAWSTRSLGLMCSAWCWTRKRRVAGEAK